MHLHARRLRIDAPDGKTIDVTVEPPAHFAESLSALGFDLEAGTAMPLHTADPARSPEVKARRAAAAAKTARKARKGERRSRGSGGPSASRKPKRR
jgi:23S rRNA pseudouridine955/2504/2580 synthase